MSRDAPTPFATRRVLRGLALALRLAEAKAARAPEPPPLTASEVDDVARARAWLDEAVRARKLVRP